MNVTQELYDTLCGLTKAQLNEDGHELLNPVPVNVNIDLEKPLSLKEQIQRLMRNELSLQADLQGHETFEEANDFDVEDEFFDDNMSGFEVLEDEVPLTAQEPQPEATADGEEVPTEETASEVPQDAPAPPAD